MSQRQATTAELTVHDADGAIQFYEKAMGATVKHKEAVQGDPKKRIMHCMLEVPGGGQVMVHDDFPDWTDNGQLSTPVALGGNPVTINLFMPSLESLDALVERSSKEGMKVLCPATDMFWGDRHAKLKDPYGHVWALVSPLPAERKASVAGKVPKGDGQEFKEQWKKDAGLVKDGSPPPAKKQRLTRATLVEERKIAAAPEKVYGVWVAEHRRVQPLPEGAIVQYDEEVAYKVDAVERCQVMSGDGSPMCRFEEKVLEMDEGFRVVWHTVCEMPSGQRLSTSLSTVEFLPAGSETRVVLTEQVTWFRSPLLEEHRSALERFLANLDRAVLAVA